MSDVHIRPYDGSFRSAVAELIVPIQQQEFGIPITYEEQPDLADIEGFYQVGGGEFWLAVASGRVVGTVALRDIGNRAGALRKMFVAAEWRGPGRGISRALLDTLLNHARAQGLRTIWLGTTAKFLAAHRFYEKSGFNLVEASELPESFPRMKVDTRFYRIIVEYSEPRLSR
jgi:N-acetylglutamate synthase-like GNAT family acetyltransferase